MEILPRTIGIAALVSFAAMSALCAWVSMGMAPASCMPTVMNIAAAVPPAAQALLVSALLLFAALFFLSARVSEAAAQRAPLVRPPDLFSFAFRFLQELFSRGVLHPRLYATA